MELKENNNNPYPDKIWIMWLQGYDNAPEIVKLCIDSIKKYSGNKEIILIDKDNISNYVNLPDFIEEKYKKGIISHAAYSDIVRSYLLYYYGGTWIDSTLYCTKNIEFLFDNDFLIYREYSKRLPYYISNWFIHSKNPYNKLIKCILLSLYNYWKYNNKIVHYFLFYFFHRIAISEDIECKQIWDNTPVFLTYNAKLFLRELCGYNGGYNKKMVEYARGLNHFHKLTYKTDYFVLKIDQDKLVSQIKKDICEHS